MDTRQRPFVDIPWTSRDLHNVTKEAVVFNDIRTLEAIAASEPWMRQARCAETDPEIFFPEKGGSVRDAKKVCHSCDVRAECLAYALDRDEVFGVWGGMSEPERRRLQMRGLAA